MTLAIPDTVSRADCEELDASDPLGPFRRRFVVGESDVIYLDGNSLGRLPRDTPPRLSELVEGEWGRGLVRSWTDAEWMSSPLRVGGKVARLIGAQSDEVLVTDSTTVNLFKLITAVLRSRPDRTVVLSETDNFPTDRYVAAGVAALLPDHSARFVEREEIARALDSGVALLTLAHVDYRTGEVHDMRALTDAAHAQGALVLWDLSHSAGAIPVDLNGTGADLAVGCGYKYLNGGPGAPAYLFVTRGLQDELRNPIQGWLGHESPFGLEVEFRRAAGMRGWLSGSPPIMAIAALEVAVEMLLEIGMDRVGEKSQALTELFIRLADRRLAQHGFELATPREPARRGSHVSLRHPSGYGVVRALIDRGVIPDFRDPDICRFGLAPLYTRHVDVWDAVASIVDVMESRAYENPAYAERAFIT